MPVDPIRLKDIFSEAVTRTDPSDRAAYLEAACDGDAGLRSRVEALLRASEEPDSLLDEPASPGPTDVTGTFAPDAHRPESMVTGEFGSDAATGTFGGSAACNERSAPTELGSVIAGRYTLVEVIGEGGMGSVYLASQSEPVKRQVALKLIKTGMDSKGVLARFDAERQALALMDHPNIARIYDGGVTPAGQPFFVMELVKGVPLTDYCDAHRLTVDARLQLFVSVCQAVQHAHQKGIIHRDLKPGNVLVTEVDGRPTPKVIDFGVAKATELKLTDMSFADTGAIVGTPAYMSPEQADPSSMDIDTRTDVYALGVILYELLTGAPPIDSKQFKRGAILEMLRMVREVEPPRPSSRLSAANARPNIAADRSIEPAKLSKLLQGELDWVVMKALEKDRTRRYETANGFAADILRYLADEVVEARPPSTGYRLKKFVRRHKGQVAAAGLVLVTLVGGIAGTTLGLIEARRQGEEAKSQEQIARDESFEKEKARAAEALRVTERDHALGMQRQALAREAERADELKHRLGVSQVVLAAAAYENRDVALAAERLNQVPSEQRGWEWRYLKEQTRGGLFTLRVHTVPVTCVAYSPDGTRIVTGAGSEVRVWDARTGAALLDLKGLSPPPGANVPVTSVAFSPDGTRLVTGGGEVNKSGEAKVWDARAGTLLIELKGHKAPVYRVVFSPDGTRLATASDDGTVKVWDAVKGTVLLELKGHRGGVTGVAFSPDGTRVVSGSYDGTVKVWDAVMGGTPQLDVRGVTSGYSTVAFSPDGTKLVTGRADGTASVIDAGTGAVLLELKGRLRGLDASPLTQMGVLSAAFSPDGSRIVTAGGVTGGSRVSGAGGEVTVWDVRTGAALTDLVGHTDMVMSAAFSPDGMHVITGSCDHTAKVWDARTGSGRLELGRDRDDVRAVAFSPDGTRIVTAEGVFTPPGELAPRGAKPRAATIWDARTGLPLVELKGFKGTVTCVAFSPDGTRLVTGGVASQKVGGEDFTVVSAGEATVWDARTGLPLIELKGFSEGVNSVAFSPDGTRVVTGAVQDLQNAGTEVKVWDARTGAVLLALAEPIPGRHGIYFNHKGGSVAFSPDGTRILVAGIREKNRDGHRRRVMVCDARTGAVVVELKGDVGPVLSAALSPDGTRIATGGWGVGKVWDARAGTLLVELKGHTGNVNSVAFSPDGTRVVTGSGDRTVRVWDARTGASLVELRGHAGFVTSVSFSPDGTRIAAGGCAAAGKPGEVIVWDAPVSKSGLVLEGPTGINGATFSPDGTRILADSGDGSLRVWDARAGTLLFELKLRPEALASVTFSLDGTRMITNGDGPAVVWDARTGKELPGEAVPEQAAARLVSPDGRLRARVDGDRVEVSPVEPDPDELARRRLHTRPDPWRYRNGYLAARAGGDDFAARFYLEQMPPAGRAALVAIADVSALAALFERAARHEEAGERDKALPLLVEIMNVTQARLGAEDPAALDAAARVGRAYQRLGRFDQAIPLHEAVLKGRVAKLGWDHIDTLDAAVALGEGYASAGRPAEAIPVLEEAYRAAKPHPSRLEMAATQLIALYATVGEHGKRVRLIQERVADLRKRLPPGHPELHDVLSGSGELLLQSNAFVAAEPLLREGLAAYEKRMPDAWPTFHIKSLLGAALLRQKKYADAEPLLLAGYEGMKQREKTIPTVDGKKLRLPEALDRLIELYTATNKPDEVKKWRAARAKYPTPKEVAPPPREKK